MENQLQSNRTDESLAGPGEAPVRLVNPKPKMATRIPKVTQYDMFEFETIMRKLIDE